MTKDSSIETAKTLCQEGIALARAGDKATALERFRQTIVADPTNEVAWLHLAGLASTLDDAYHALEQVRQINPDNVYLEKAYAWANQIWPTSDPFTKQDDPHSLEKVVKKEDALEKTLPWQITPSAMKKEDALERTLPLQITPSLEDAQLIPSGTIKVSPQSKWPGTVVWTWGLVGVLLLGALIPLGYRFTGRDVMNDTPVSNLIGALFPTPTNTVLQELAQLQVAVEAASLAADQPAVIKNLEKMYALAPYNEDITNRLAEHYYEQGLVLRNGGNFEAAQIAFNRALAIQDTMKTAQLERKQVTLYLTGMAYHQQGKWARAIDVFEEIYNQTPHYPFLNEILYNAYFNQGIVQEAGRDLEEALLSFKRAAEILPGRGDARHKIEAVALVLYPPTPTPAPTATTAPTPTPAPTADKRIVVDISEQHAYTYQGNTQIHNFIISTGEPGRDTAIGTFEIQNKIPVAYASTWNLDMPYWLGIYWSGPLQNGFHAVPTVRHTGQTMWDGYLGQRVSYGCVILSLADAKKLYNWADVGTSVTIQW